MGKGNIVAGLDMGSGRIACILASKDEETRTLKVLSGAVLPCRGLKGGVVVDIKETSNAVAQIIEQAEKDADVDVDQVYLGVRGLHLQSLNSHGAYNIARSDKEINSEDVNFAIENAKAIPLSSDRDIIHVIPQSFSIDRQRGVPNPEGMEGSLLEVDVHIVTASNSHLNNLVKSVAKAGFSVEEPLYGIVALGECALTPEEKDLGAVLIDLGGETLSVAIYLDGAIKFSKEIPYGCDLITRDIAYGLHTSRETAKVIKEKYGIASPAALLEDEEIPVPSLDNRTSHSIKRSFLLEIVQPRVEELFDKVREEIQKSRYADSPGVGVITGGGSLLKGMADQCSQSLGLREVRQAAVLRDLVASDEEFFGTAYSTAMAAAIYPSIRRTDAIDSGSAKKAPLIEKVKGFFTTIDIFGKD